MINTNRMSELRAMVNIYMDNEHGHEPKPGNIEETLFIIEYAMINYPDESQDMVQDMREQQS